MMERTKRPTGPISRQMKNKIASDKEEVFTEYDGNFYNTVSTGSTLLDLAISGGRVRGGGLPAGILVEIFGPSGSGKTVLLSSIAGCIQEKGGLVKFHDPEARINPTFSKMFGMKLEDGDYYRPDTVPEVFKRFENGSLRKRERYMVSWRTHWLLYPLIWRWGKMTGIRWG